MSEKQIRSSLIEEIERVVGAPNVLTSPAEIDPFVNDWRGYEKGTALAVVLPADAEEVSELMGIALRHGVVIVPQGGNTGLSRGATPVGLDNCIVVALRRMASLRQVDKPSNVMIVDAGMTLAAAHEAATRIGRRIPLRLGSEGTAQIGGLVSTNAGGTGALRYGPMRDLVCGVEAVLPDGRILRDLSALRKNNTGYDLKHIFVGAEGTLGIVTAVALRLQPMIRASGHAWISVKDPVAAISLLMEIQDAFDTWIQAVELVSGNAVAFVLSHIPRTRQPFDAVPEWSLMIELGGPDASADIRGKLEEWLAVALEKGSAVDAFVARNEAQAADIWHVRHSTSEANKLQGHSLSHDVAVRPSRVPELISLCTAAVKNLHPEAEVVIVSHIGDGNVHFIVHFTHEQWKSIDRPEKVTAEVMAVVHDIVAGLDGTFSAEHGIGRKLTGELARRIDPVRLDLMRKIRDAMDPNRRMNPNVLFDD